MVGVSPVPSEWRYMQRIHAKTVRRGWHPITQVPCERTSMALHCDRVATSA